MVDTDAANLRLVVPGVAAIGNGGTTLTSGTAYLLDANEDSQGNYQVYVDGVLDGSGVGANTNPAQVSIRFGVRGTTDNRFSGDLHEFLVYGRVLSAGEQTAVRNYLTAKWGL